MAFKSTFAAQYGQQEDEQFTGFKPGTDLSSSFSSGLGDVGATNQELGTAFGETAIAGVGKWRAAKEAADAYKRQVDEARSASKNKGIFGGLFGLGGTIASFIPGGQVIGAALGAGAKAFG